MTRATTDPSESLFPLGTMLLVGGAVLSLLAIVVGAGAFYGSMRRVVASIPSPGTHELDAPADRLWLLRPIELDDGDRAGTLVFGVGDRPGARPNTDSKTGSNTRDQPDVSDELTVRDAGGVELSLDRAPDAAWFEIDGTRARVVGTLELTPGSRSLDFTGPPGDFPLEIRSSPAAAGARAVKIAGAFMALPAALTIAGTVVGVRNMARESSRRSRLLDELAEPI
ncbi:MAG: hypothetical protein AAF108_09555 [Planctomycetota bacterium]